jgi:tetratricopeptide (TPR) repeat protein
MEEAHYELVEKEGKVNPFTKEACGHLKRAYELDPENPCILLAIAQHFLSIGDLHQTKICLTNAEIGTNKFEFSGELSINKIKAILQCLKGLISHIEEGIDSSMTSYQAAYSLWSDDPKILLCFGQACLKKGFISEAKDSLERILMVCQPNHEIYRILGSLEGANGNLKKARKFLSKAISSNPADIDSLIDYAQICEKSDSKEALNAYNKALDFFERKQKDAPYQLLNNCAVVELSQKNFLRARELLDRALQTYGSEKIHPTLNFNKALAAEALGDVHTAETLYREILNSSENLAYPYVDAYLRLSSMFEKKGDFESAEEVLRKCLQIQPDSPLILIALGNLFINRCEKEGDDKHLSEAENIFRKLPESNEYGCLSIGAIYVKKFLKEKRDKKLVCGFVFYVILLTCFD